MPRRNEATGSNLTTANKRIGTNQKIVLMVIPLKTSSPRRFLMSEFTTGPVESERYILVYARRQGQCMRTTIVSGKRIRELLAELNRELRNTEDIDEETRELLQELNDDIDAFAGPSPAVERARNLESRFAADHPVAARVAREIADLLTKMGI